MINILKKGFTLIELLIVIAIIAILTALLTTNLQAARERARDSRRKTDMQAINQSLRLYYSDRQTFPGSGSGIINGCGAAGVTACPWNSAFSNSTTTYMGNLPLDPSSTTTVPKYYFYHMVPGGNNFILLTTLENLSDADIALSQSRCAIPYASAITGYTKDPTKDYVVCAE